MRTAPPTIRKAALLLLALEAVPDLAALLEERELRLLLVQARRTREFLPSQLDEALIEFNEVLMMNGIPLLGGMAATRDFLSRTLDAEQAAEIVADITIDRAVDAGLLRGLSGEGSRTSARLSTLLHSRAGEKEIAEARLDRRGELDRIGRLIRDNPRDFALALREWLTPNREADIYLDVERYDRLSLPQKAALFLLSISPGAAGEILNGLHRGEITTMAFELQQLDRLRGGLDLVLIDFMEVLLNEDLIPENSLTDVHELLEQLRLPALLEEEPVSAPEFMDMDWVRDIKAPLSAARGETESEDALLEVEINEDYRAYLELSDIAAEICRDQADLIADFLRVRFLA